MKKKLIITIDGPSGTGKSTAARGLARRLGFLYLDTGAMYRAVALQALRKKVALSDSAALARLAEKARMTFRKGPGSGVRIFLNGRDVSRLIRRPEVSSAASKVAVVSGVRKALVRRQRLLGRAGGLVAEGRDTGTVVFPHADLKVFMSAGAAERARRRCRELKEAGHRVTFPQVLREVRQRDRRDRNRAISPLKPAPGAVRINNTRLQSTQVLAKLIDYVRGV